MVELVDALRSGRSEGDLVGVRLPPQAFFLVMMIVFDLDGGIQMEITVTFPGNKKTSARVGEFDVITDQSVMAGGDGSAPAPFTLFMVSIASCAGIYAVYFCEKRGIPLDDIKVVQRDERDPTTHRVTRITLEIVLPADFPEKYKKALLHTVDLCAVKKTMLDPPEFELTTVTAG